MKIIFATMMAFSNLAFSAPNNDEMKARDALSDRARARQYDGGVDEQPLIVQPSLSEPRSESSEALLQRKAMSEDGETPVEPATDETAGGF